jgi:hypothetical protein
MRKTPPANPVTIERSNKNRILKNSTIPKMSWLVLLILLVLFFIILVIYCKPARNITVEFMRAPAMRNISNRFIKNEITPKIINYISRVNSNLTGGQIAILSDLLGRCWNSFLDGKPIKPMLRSIVSLAVPYGEYVYSIVEFAGQYFTLSPGASASDATNAKTAGADEVQHSLESFGCSKRLIRKIPINLRMAISDALSDARKSADVSCVISGEPIFNNNTLVSGIAALPRSVNNEYFISFYKVESLEQWFRAGSRIDPMTRSPADQYYLIT